MKKILEIYSGILKSSRAWIYFSAGVGLAWLIAGFTLAQIFPHTMPAFLTYLHQTFENILGDIERQQPLALAWALFKQNSGSALYSLFFGAIFGFVPIASLAFNFFILGFLAGGFLQPQNPGGSLGLFLLSIIPHGVFELPALLLACAFGFRLGWRWLLPASSGRRVAVWKSDFLRVVKILPLVLVLLVAAAIVEAFVTNYLVR